MHIPNYGEVSEWSIVLPWKGSVESNQPGVRISLSPLKSWSHYML